MTSQPINLVLFDLGGVLVHVSGMEQWQQWIGFDDRQDAVEAWIGSLAVDAFESGRMTTDEFAKAIVAEQDLAMSPADFVRDFRGWLDGPIDGSAQLVEDLAATGIPIGCFSNTNPIHWEAMADYPFMSTFDPALGSFLVGAAKPHRDTFVNVATELGLEPATILFLDDSTGNVEGAKSAGWSSELTRGPDDARQILIRHQLLP